MDREAVPDLGGHFGSVHIRQRLPAMDVAVGLEDEMERRLRSSMPIF